jgi:superfamily I DNA/RNA helicase
MRPSKYQLTIIDAVVKAKDKTNQSFVVNALAGSGKTSTLLLICNELLKTGVELSDIQILVFAKENEQTLKQKFGRLWKSSISTLHSIGRRYLAEYYQWKNKPALCSQKYTDIGERLGYYTKTIKRETVWGTLLLDNIVENESDFKQLFDLSRVNLSDCSPASLKNLCNHYNIEGINDFVISSKIITEILNIGSEEAKQGFYDFTDMIYLPSKIQQKIKKQPKWILVDECQDLNAAQLNLALKIGNGESNYIFVGDRHQAIYGFAGADCNSVETIVQKTIAIQMPLSICYRCPESHIKLVQSTFPILGIEQKNNVSKGVIELLGEYDAIEKMIDGDLVLCRFTAPLILMCIKLLGEGKKAIVKGTDIAKKLAKTLRKIAKIKNFNYSRFLEFSQEFLQKKLKQLYEKDLNAQAWNLKDEIEAIETIYRQRSDINSIEALIDSIIPLFSDQDSPITLCTIHRAKGLEKDRVYLLEATIMPCSFPKMTSWQIEQESNLLYVALTRSTHYLGIVGYRTPHWLPAELLEQYKYSNFAKVITQDTLKEGTTKQLQLI